MPNIAKTDEAGSGTERVLIKSVSIAKSPGNDAPRLLDDLAIHDRRVPGPGVAGVEPGELESIDQEEAAIADPLGVEHRARGP